MDSTRDNPSKHRLVAGIEKRLKTDNVSVTSHAHLRGHSLHFHAHKEADNTELGSIGCRTGLHTHFHAPSGHSIRG